MSGRTMTARVGGRTYEIPEIWLVGFCTSNRCDVAAAVEWWHQQSMMADECEQVAP